MSKMPDPAVQRTRRALLDFYDTHRRALPWRENPRPYRVWIAEVMLQQTRVDAVLPYYRAWMERFPDVQALAEASLDDVLKAWEGLGYYARARNLHRAALVLRDGTGGELPTRAAELRRLPGFGEYTSGAVASIAFGEAVPAVDGNARRVFARLLDEPEPTPRWLREQASALVDPERPGDFNQALMELGATVCTPRAPGCGRCPLGAQCRARKRGTVLTRPRPRRRGAMPDVEIAVAALVRRAVGRGPELLLTRRPAEGLLGGLWELPGLEVGRGGAEPTAARAAAAVGLTAAGAATPLPVVAHAFSHFRGVYRPFLWDLGPWDPGEGAGRGAADVVWADAEGLAALALPRAQRKIAERVLHVAAGRAGRIGDGPPWGRSDAQAASVPVEERGTEDVHTHRLVPGQVGMP